MGKLYYGDVRKRAERAGLSVYDVEKPGTKLKLVGNSETVLAPNSVGLFDEAEVDDAIARLTDG
jgi:hypothetical protein